MVSTCWDVLLRGAPTEAATAPAQTEALTTLRELEADEAPAALPILAAAATERPLRVLAVLGLVCLMNPTLAQALLCDDVLVYAVPKAEKDADCACAFAHMLAEGASHPQLRQHFRAQPRIQAWLQNADPLGPWAPVCTDLVRVKLAIPTEAQMGPSALSLADDTCAALYERFAGFVRHHTFESHDDAPWDFHSVSAAQSDALEGLYYLSFLPTLREALSQDAPLLHKLGTRLSACASSASEGPGSAPSEAFVIVSLLATVVAYPPVLSEQEKQVDALRRSATKRGPDDPRLAPTCVAQRVRRIVDAGLVPPLVALTTRASPPQYRILADLFLALVTEQDAIFRGRLVQMGVCRALLWLAQKSLATLSSPIEAAQLVPFQALAKLSISTDPALLYGEDGKAMRAVAYLGVLFLAPCASLLQVFEAALALTNLSSMSPTLATAVAHASCPQSEQKTVAESIVPLFLQHESLMLRRALIELLCNMAQDEGVFAYWSGETERDAPAAPASSASAPLRLHTAEGRLRFLLSLCHTSTDAHEIALAKAASGLLAMLSSSPVTCEHLIHLPTDTWTPLLALLPAKDLPEIDTWELALRALTIFLNLCDYAAWLGSPERSAPVLRQMHAAGLVRTVRALVETAAVPPSTPDARALHAQVLSLCQSILQRVST